MCLCVKKNDTPQYFQSFFKLFKSNIMKKLVNISFFLMVLCPLLTFAQGKFAAYSTQLPTKGFWGQKYKLSASMKTDELDTHATPILWIDGHNSTKGTTFFKELGSKPAEGKEWKTYSLEGLIDSNTAKIECGVMAKYNGLFYFDDVTLAIQKSDSTWETVYANNFEQDKWDLKEGSEFLNISANTYFIARLEKKETNTYLKIEGAGIIHFGNNEARGKFADVNGVQLYYETYGEGQPLIVLHHFEDRIESYDVNYPELMKKYRLILVDMRGQNYKTPLSKTDSLTYTAMAADINQLMEQLKIDSAHFWGVVTGAKVGLLMAKDYPKRVKKLLAYGLFIQTDSTAVSPLMFKRYEERSKQIDDVFEKRLVAFLISPEANSMPFSALTTIKTPVFLVSGDRGSVLKEHTEKIFKSLPNAQMRVLPGGSRGITQTKNDAFLSIMENFFGN